MGAGDLIVVPDSATISEAAALLCRGLEESQKGKSSEDRLSRASSQDVIAVLIGQPPASSSSSSTSHQDDDSKSSSTSSAAGGSEAAADPAATLTRWEDWFTFASFSHPHVMSRLERLMGTNVVRITDRKYMLELQRRIREDHVRTVRERIRAREVDELEREKKLILDGRMSLDEAPKELVDHPVFQISQFIKNVLLGGKIPRYLRAVRNHVQPARLCQMASNVSRSSSSRGMLATSRSLLASEDDRVLATPTTLAAAASRPASTSLSVSSRASTPRESRKGSARADDGAHPEAADEADEGDEAEDQEVTEAGAETAPAQATEEEPATGMEPGIVVRVQDAEEAAEDDDDNQSGMSACDFEEDFDRQADVERGYMFTQEDFDRIKFEAESVKKMWELETVEELYALAESIVKEMVAQGGGATPAPGVKSVSPSPSRRPSINPAPADT